MEPKTIKMSDFLYKFFSVYAEERAKQGESAWISPEYVQGNTHLQLSEEYGDNFKIVSDTWATDVTETQCLACYGQNTRELKACYDAQDREGFDKIVITFQEEDDAFEEAKRRQELENAMNKGEVDPGFDHTLG